MKVSVSGTKNKSRDFFRIFFGRRPKSVRVSEEKGRKEKGEMGRIFFHVTCNTQELTIHFEVVG